MDLCIYHGGCTDGVAAAWAVWVAEKATEFYPGAYQQDPPWDKIEQATSILLVDFSYKRPVMEEIERRANVRPVILDHHKTAHEDVGPLLEAGVWDGEFDMDRCGALMAWDYFHGVGTRPLLLQEIDAQDRWLPTRNAPLIMALRSWPHAPSDDLSWDQLMHQWSRHMHLDGTEQLRQDGDAIYRYYRARVDETKRHAAPMRIGEFANVPVVNAPYSLASEVAGELASDSPDGIAAVWWRNKDGSVTFSLRSRGNVDAAALAVSFGGGGHDQAAGFKVSWSDFVRMCG